VNALNESFSKRSSVDSILAFSRQAQSVKLDHIEGRLVMQNRSHGCDQERNDEVHGNSHASQGKSVRLAGAAKPKDDPIGLESPSPMVSQRDTATPSAATFAKSA
jgi:hypothetical protein